MDLGPAEAAVADFKSAGGQVEYVLVLVQEARHEEEQHRLAVVAGLEEIARRSKEWVQRRSDESRIPRNEFWEMTITPSRARGRPIDLKTFLGRAYDHDAGRIVSLWETLTADAHGKPDDGKYATDGYAEAFSDPPYSIQADLDQLNYWFESINRALFGGLSEGLRIWEWETDWSNWFEAGHEWWGSFCWTVQQPGSQMITVIAASSTD